MLDIKFIRENLELVREAARKKHIEVDLDRLIALDTERLELTASAERMRARQNAANREIPSADVSRKDAILDEMKALKDELQRKEERLKSVLREWRAVMLQVPNVPDISVPDGNSDMDNKEVRRWPDPSGVEGGGSTRFDFEPKSHIELMQNLGMLDLDRGVKVAGFRGYFLTGLGATLTFALWRFVFDEFAKKGGFTPIIAPSLVRQEPFWGTGYLPQGEEDLYKTQDGEYLAGTSEVAAMGYHMDEVIEKKDLPKKFFAFSPCFRREAGSHGKDTKGVMRVHEFYKFEQVVLCEATHEESVRQHEALTENAEELLRKLELPYRVVVNCGADLGLGQVKKYDIEAWVPSENRYRETHSSSYFHDFQTRRLNIRYRDSDGTLKFAHSLNNTALATPRILIPLVENNQRADGSIKVPKALEAYLGLSVIAHEQ